MDRRYRKKMQNYWDKRWKVALSELQEIDIESWFDFWHVHPDWYFKGNRDSEMRAWVVTITYDFLKVVETFTEAQQDRLQVWASIAEDTGNNAVFIHSENPNGTDFPYDFSSAQWGVELTQELSGIVDLSTHELGKASIKNEVVYFIRKKALAF